LFVVDRRLTANEEDDFLVVIVVVECLFDDARKLEGGVMNEARG